jgi:Fe-S-cluster containining protein
MPVGEFVTLMSFTVEEVVRYERDNVPLHFVDRPADRRFLLALKRVDSALFPGTQRCWFLQEWKRETEAPERGEHPGRHTLGRCGIYGSRPHVCRIFPTALHATLPLGLIHQRPLEASGLSGALAGCPEEWTVEKFGVEPDAALHALAVHRFEREFYAQASREFNEAQLPLAEFFPFMARVLAHRFRAT